MTSLNQYFYILELAALGQLPEQLDDASEYPLPVIRELIEAGYLAALDVSTLGGEEYLNPRITLTGREYLRKLQSEHEAAVDELLAVLDKLRAIMTTVATSNYPIDDANDEYQKLYRSADAQLSRMGIVHTNPYRSLWDWRARWKSGDLPSYQSRRDFLGQVFTPLMQQVSGNVGSSVPPASLTSGVPGRTQESPPPTPSIQSLPVVQEVPQPLAKLTGQQVKQLRNVLVNAFTKDSLRQMVRIELEENLEAIVGSDSLSDIAFDLIRWAEREGRVSELVQAVYETIPQNEQVQQIWHASHHWYTDQ